MSQSIIITPSLTFVALLNTIYFVHFILIRKIMLSPKINVSVFISSYFLSCIYVHTLKLTNNKNLKIMNIAYDLVNTTRICISLQYDALPNNFEDVFRRIDKFSVLTFSDLKTTPYKECESVLVLDNNGYENCKSDFVGNSVVTRLIYFFNHSPSFNISSLENCFSHSSSPEVVSVSLVDGTLYELSPVFPRPRHFARSGVQEVIKHRSRSTKPDLGGEALVVTVVKTTPLVIFNYSYETAVLYKPGDIFDDDGHYVDGIEVMFVRHLSRQMNFTIKFIKGNGWNSNWTGHVTGNDSWLGGVAQIMQDGIADLAVADLWQAAYFYDIFDFGPTFTEVQIAFMVRRPEEIPFRLSTLLTIFEPWVWLATLASFVVVVSVYLVGVIQSQHSYHVSDYSKCFLAIFGHSTMNFYSKGREMYTRYTLTSWSAFAVLFTSALSSGIFIRLTTPHYAARVDTIQQLVENQYYWSAQFYNEFQDNTGLIESVFNLEDPWHRMYEKTYKYMDPEEIYEKVENDDKMLTFPVLKQEDFVTILNDGFNFFEELMRYRVTKEETNFMYKTFGIKKNSPLLEPLTITSMEILEMGFFSYWKDEVLRRWPGDDRKHVLREHDKPTFRGPQQLKLKLFKPFFYLLSAGLALASLVFFIEISYRRYLLNWVKS